MTYNKIFWLEDNPNFFFDVIAWRAKQMQRPLDIAQLLSRITLAYDFDTGKMVVKRERFDLYILDADFPNKINEGKRAKLEEYFAKVRRKEQPAYPWETDFKDGQVPNNFAPFYLNNLDPGKKMIVYSMSLDAWLTAFVLDIPIYAKRSTTEEEIRKEIEKSWGGHGGVRYDPAVPEIFERYKQKGGGPASRSPVGDMLASYECGGVDAFIERYLR